MMSVSDQNDAHIWLMRGIGPIGPPWIIRRVTPDKLYLWRGEGACWACRHWRMFNAKDGLGQCRVDPSRTFEEWHPVTSMADWCRKFSRRDAASRRS